MFIWCIFVDTLTFSSCTTGIFCDIERAYICLLPFLPKDTVGWRRCTDIDTSHHGWYCHWNSDFVSVPSRKQSIPMCHLGLIFSPDWLPPQLNSSRSGNKTRCCRNLLSSPLSHIYTRNAASEGSTVVSPPRLCVKWDMGLTLVQ